MCVGGIGELVVRWETNGEETEGDDECVCVGGSGELAVGWETNGMKCGGGREWTCVEGSEAERQMA